jgi:hypothetical protein
MATGKEMSTFNRFCGDLAAFIRALVPCWAAFITGGSGAAVIAIVQALGGRIPHWVVWALIFLAFFAAAFRAHRGQCRITESEAKALEDQQKQHADEMQNAKSECAELRREKEENNMLVIVLEKERAFWTCKDFPRDETVCRVGVKNISRSKTARNVGLSLFCITNPNGEKENVNYEFGATGNVATKGVTINAGDTVLFDILKYGTFSRCYPDFLVLDRPSSDKVIRSDNF